MKDSPDSRHLGDRTVAAAIRGDASAIQALWQANRRWLAAVLLAYKSRQDDLEDLLQEVAMTLVEKVSTLREETNLRAWLRVVAMNAARASARSGRYRPRLHLAEDDLPQEDVSPEWSVAQRDHRARLAGAVAELPEIYREPLLLRAVQGMRSKQIAEILEIPPATVDTRIARARGMLRAALSDAEPDEADWRDRSIEAGQVPGRSEHDGRLT